MKKRTTAANAGSLGRVVIELSTSRLAAYPQQLAVAAPPSATRWWSKLLHHQVYPLEVAPETRRRRHHLHPRHHLRRHHQWC